MEKHQFIENLGTGDRVKDFFLVRKVIPKDDPEIVICDKTGEIKLTFMYRTDVEKIMNTVRSGEIVFVKEGIVDDRNGEKRIYVRSLDDIKKIEIDEIETKDIFPSLSKIHVENMLNELRKYIESLKNDHLKSLLKKIFYDEDFIERFVSTPSSIDHHHNYIGGNLEHTLNVVRICDSISKINKSLDRDILITGAMIHDIGKSLEYKPHTLYEKTEEGILLGHIILGERLVRERIEDLRSEGIDFPKDLNMIISHMILSHHGKQEWGSPETPKTLEALVLHYADLMDSQIKYHEQKINSWKRSSKNKWMLIWDNDIKKKKTFLHREIK